LIFLESSLLQSSCFHAPILKISTDSILTVGMQTVWVMGNETEVLNIPINDVEGYLDYGGNVNGNDTHAPRVVHFKSGNI